MVKQYTVVGSTQWNKVLLIPVDRRQKMKGSSPTAPQQSQRLTTKPSTHGGWGGGDLDTIFLGTNSHSISRRWQASKGEKQSIALLNCNTLWITTKSSLASIPQGTVVVLRSGQ